MQPPHESYSEDPQQVRIEDAPFDQGDQQQWDSASLGYGSVQQGFDPSYIPPHYTSYPAIHPDTSLGDPFDVSSWNQQGKEQYGQNALGFVTENNANLQTEPWRQMGFMEQSPHPHAQPASAMGPYPTPQHHHAPNPNTTTPHPSHPPSGIYTPSITHHSTPVGSTDFSDINAYWTFVNGHQDPDPYPTQQLVLPPPAAYPSPMDPGLAVAVDNSASTVGPTSARSKFSTDDYLNFPQSASPSHSHPGAQHHPITPHRMTPIIAQHPSPLSMSSIGGQPESRGTESLAKRGGKPKSLGIKRKLPDELRYSQSPSTLAPPQPLPMSSRSHSFSEGSRVLVHTPFRDPPMTARSLPAHIEAFSPQTRSLGSSSTAPGPIHNLEDVQRAVTNRIRSFNEDVTKIMKSVPRSVLLQPGNDSNRDQQVQLATLLEMVHTIQNACAKLHITDQSGSSAVLGALRQQQLSAPFPSVSRPMAHRNSISNASDMHSPRPPTLTPIGPEITALKMSHDITLWHNGSSAPPPHEYPSVVPPLEPVHDPHPATVYGAHPPPDKTIFAPSAPHLTKAPPISSAPPAPVPNLLFGAWHQSEIDRLCHVWLLSKREYLTKLRVDFTDWCGTIPEKMLTCRVLMASPAHHYMVSLNEIAKARPGYQPPPPEVYYSPPNNPLQLDTYRATGVYVGGDPTATGAAAQPQNDIPSKVRPDPAIPVEDTDITIGQEALWRKKDRVGRMKGTPGYAEARAKLNAELAPHMKLVAEKAGKPWPPVPDPPKASSSTDEAKPKKWTEEDHRRQAAERRAQELVEALSRAPPDGDPRLRLFPAPGELTTQENYGGTYSKVQKKYRIDEGIDWTYVCDQMMISRSKNQIMFRAVEWGLKERERRNMSGAKRKKKLTVKNEDGTEGPYLIHGIDLTAVKAKGDKDEFDNAIAEIKRRAAESFLHYDPTRSTPPTPRASITALPESEAEPGRKQDADTLEGGTKSKGKNRAVPQSAGEGEGEGVDELGGT